MKSKKPLSAEDIDRLEGTIASEAHKATRAAYLHALQATGSVLVARDGKLVMHCADGSETVMGEIGQRVKKAKSAYPIVWTPPSHA